MEICDAHFHFDMKSTDPILDMFQTIADYQLSAVVLILNSECEFQVLTDNWKQLSDCGMKIHLALLMDIHDQESFYKKARWMDDRQIRYSIKLHPRLSGIQKKDFRAIGQVLQDMQFENIIIDSFYYGCRLENLIYDELAIYLAKRYRTKKIVMSHFGGVDILKTMLCTKEIPNIYYDISCTINYFANTSVWMDIFHCIRMNADRVMYGSDHPEFSEECSLLNIRRLFDQFSGKQDLYKKILFENAFRIYFGGK